MDNKKVIKSKTTTKKNSKTADNRKSGFNAPTKGIVVTNDSWEKMKLK